MYSVNYYYKTLTIKSLRKQAELRKAHPRAKTLDFHSAITPTQDALPIHINVQYQTIKLKLVLFASGLRRNYFLSENGPFFFFFSPLQIKHCTEDNTLFPPKPSQLTLYFPYLSRHVKVQFLFQSMRSSFCRARRRL